jgi:hypothetical protein
LGREPVAAYPDPTGPDQKRRRSAVQVSRAHVLDIIARAGLTDAQRDRVLALPYPADQERVIELFRSMGIYIDELITRMGGSP